MARRDVLDTTVMVGAIPERHRPAVAGDALDGYFAMARGTQEVAPLEMTKWFDTNYHYLVPELGPDSAFTADSAKQVGELKEALALGLTARPVLPSPTLCSPIPPRACRRTSTHSPCWTGCCPCTPRSWPTCGRRARSGSSWTSPPSSRTAPRPS
ncbi:hypothetical protein GCM10010280_65520 [Streptomyces pilosus]|uniref:Cobalamin-independent methionine synthase MetE N-terminal domain-containing protein n=1 Tax=Streptomyces pilosus TaxID=28893 RepID=A0A918F7S9_9ACTN|nr:hypothetical protein GCM10010280_65520 [Streptomyces pilosus]